jgi:hypothetical protein
VYQITKWEVKNQITKTAVDNLLKLDANQPFMSSYLLFKRINDMTYDLGTQIWKTGKVSFTHSNAGGLLSYTQFFYCHSITGIEFLILQLAYADHMTYVPKKNYNEVGERIYSKAHIGDWWWHQQMCTVLCSFRRIAFTFKLMKHL